MRGQKWAGADALPLIMFVVWVLGCNMPPPDSSRGGLAEGAFDEAAVRAAVHVELGVARAKAFSQVYALLTAEQKTTLAERRQQFQKRGPGGPHADEAPNVQ